MYCGMLLIIVFVFDYGFISSTARAPSGTVREEPELWSPLLLCTRYVSHDFIFDLIRDISSRILPNSPNIITFDQIVFNMKLKSWHGNGINF